MIIHVLHTACKGNGVKVTCQEYLGRNFSKKYDFNWERDKLNHIKSEWYFFMFRAEDKPLRVSLSSRRQNQKFSWRDSSIMFVSSLQLVDPMGSILICMVTSIGGTVLHNYCLMNRNVKAKRRRRSRAGHKRCFCGQLQFYEIIISVKRHLTHIWDHNRSGNIMIYGIWFFIYNIVGIS